MLGAAPAATQVSVTATTTVTGVLSLDYSVNNGSSYSPLTSGAAQQISILVGSTQVWIRCVSQDSSATAIYKVDVRSNDCTLTALSFSPGSLTTSLAAGSSNYTLGVPASTSSISVTATKTPLAPGTVLQAKYAGAYISLTSGQASTAMAGTVSVDSLTVRVQAADLLSQRLYSIAVEYNDCALASLLFSVGNLTSPFSPSQFTYTLGVPVGTLSVPRDPAEGSSLCGCSDPSGEE